MVKSTKNWCKKGHLFRPGVGPQINPKNPFLHHLVEIAFFWPPALLLGGRHRFWTNQILHKGCRCKIPLGNHFCPMGPKAVFLEPLPYDQKADIGFEQACFFQKGGDAASPLGIVFTLSVGKLFFLTPCLITWWPTSVLNRPASFVIFSWAGAAHCLRLKLLGNGRALGFRVLHFGRRI